MDEIEMMFMQLMRTKNMIARNYWRTARNFQGKLN
jgi:hypothetical protein